jgi:WD40 repeat protein
MGGSAEARGIFAGFDLARPKRVQTDPVPRCRQRALSADTRSLLCINEHSVSLWTDLPFREKWSKPMEIDRAVFLESTDEVALFNFNTPSIVFLSTDTGSLISNTRVRSNPAIGLRFSSDGSTIVDFVESRTTDRLSGERRDISLCADAGGTSLGVHTRDSTYAVICRENSLAVGGLYEASESTPLNLPSGFHSMRNRATLLEGGRWVLLSTVKSAMALIDLQSRQIVRSFETNVGHLRDFVVSPNNRVLAVAGTRGGVRLMDLSTGAWLGRLPAQGAVNQIRFVDDHQLLVLGDRLERWVLPTGLHSMLFRNEGGFSGVDFSPDSTLLAASTATGQLRVWSLASDVPIRLDDQMGALASMQWSATPGVAKDVSFTPDGKTLIGGAMDALGLGVFSTEDWVDQGALMPGLLAISHPFFRRVGALAGGWVFGLSYGQSGPEVWRLGDSETDDFFRVPGRTFFDAATNHGGTAAVMNDSTGKVFRMTTVPTPAMTSVPVAFDVASVDISSDGERVAVARPGRIEIVEVATGETKFRLVDLEGIVLDVALSADDRYLAASFMNGVVRVWVVETGALVAVLRGHTERVAAIEFSPNGRWLASASWDGTLRLWGLTVLERPADELLSEVETAWELTLKQALATDYR